MKYFFCLMLLEKSCTIFNKNKWFVRTSMAISVVCSFTLPHNEIFSMYANQISYFEGKFQNHPVLPILCKRTKKQTFVNRCPIASRFYCTKNSFIVKWERVCMCEREREIDRIWLVMDARWCISVQNGCTNFTNAI